MAIPALLRPRQLLSVVDRFESNAELVAALRQGEAAAVAVFYDRHQEMVHRVLGRMLGENPDVPDLVHDTFLSAVADIGKIHEIEKLRAWLSGVAVLTARAYLRRRARRQRLRQVFGIGWPPEVQAPPCAEAQEVVRHVYAALEGLPTEERIAFALRFIEGLSLPEVAEMCQVSLSTAKRRFSRGQEKFLRHAESNPVLSTWVREAGTHG